LFELATLTEAVKLAKTPEEMAAEDKRAMKVNLVENEPEPQELSQEAVFDEQNQANSDGRKETSTYVT
jgi:hypothetical protein